MDKISLNKILSNEGYPKIQLILDALVSQGLLKASQCSLYMYLVEKKYYLSIPISLAGQIIIRQNLFEQAAQAKISNQCLRNCLEQATVDSRFQMKDLSMLEDKVLFNNGCYDLKKQHFTSFKDIDDSILRQSCFRYSIDANYVDSDILDANTWKQYTSKAMLNDCSLELSLLETIGYLLSPSQNVKKAVFFIGVPNSGKSILLEFIAKSLPRDMTSYLDITSIGKTNSNITMFGKQLNIASDFATNKSFDLSVFKRLTSNEVNEFSGKYVRSHISKYWGKCAFAGNRLPSDIPKDEVEPFIERVLLIPFKYAPNAENKDPQLLNNLLCEKDIILSNAIRAYSKVLRNSSKFTTTKIAEADIRAYRAMLDPIQEYFKTLLQFEEGSFIRACDLKEVFKLYCKTNGIEYKRYNLHQSDVMNFNYKSYYGKRNRTSIGLGNVNGYFNLSWKIEELSTLSQQIFEIALKIKKLSKKAGES